MEQAGQPAGGLKKAVFLFADLAQQFTGRRVALLARDEARRAGGAGIGRIPDLCHHLEQEGLDGIRQFHDRLFVLRKDRGFRFLIHIVVGKLLQL